MAAPTLVESLNVFRSNGYVSDFSVTVTSELRCHACAHTVQPNEAVVETTTRFEGASNPDDQAILFGLRCRACGSLGVLVSAYGPTATAEEASVLAALSF